ncbi:MAG: restriction endonuclease subunit S [Candidatus Thiodiazotropha sp. (ex Lucinoma borealis)]|nr:restriction endonuclease subunit S [Candidatus Thiodiazotropha sp. (ex Lucinoma borealis)]MCU7866947.1 restriction endonuclease subunit S [Candidatus Thiodiazotropha sp. (ex Lucinoma borealis)]
MNEVVLNELPKNWEWTKLGDVVTKIIGGGTPSKNKPQYWDGDIPWLTVKDMRSQRPADAMDHISEKAVEESSTNIIPEDTVIIATRIGLGKVIRVPYKAAINQDLKALMVPTEIDKGYLEYWFVSKTNYLESIGSGTTVKGIRLEQVRNLDFPLAPPEQQKRIVAKIEELFSHIDAGIEALKKAKQLLKQYRQSVLKAAVTGDLTKEWREANKAKLEPATQLLERILKERRKKWEEQQLEQFKAKGKMPKDDKWKEKYPEPIFPGHLDLPNEWAAASLDQLTEYVTSGSRGWAKFYADSGATFIRAQNLKYDELDLNSIAYVSLPDKAEGMRTRVKYGDLLITITGANVTKTGYVNIDLDEAYVSQHVALCRPIRIDYVRYIYIYVISKDGARKRLEEAAYGAGKPGLNLDNLKTLQIAFPSIEEQEEIVRLVDQRFASVQRLEDELVIQLRKSEKNKQSILFSAFSGRLH